MLLSQALGKLTRHPAYWMLPQKIQREYQQSAFHPEWTLADMSIEAQTCAEWVVSLLEKSDSPIKIGPGWDESKIRRIRKGQPGAGQFAPKYVGYQRGQVLEPKQLSAWRHVLETGDGPRSFRAPYQNDPVADELLAKQGFDQLPLVLPPAEFDAWVKESGATVLYRGYANSWEDDTGNQREASSFIEQFKYGKLFWGHGIEGSGTYASTSENLALGYTSGGLMNGKRGDVMTMALLPQANVVSVGQLEKEYREYTAHQFMPDEVRERAQALHKMGDHSAAIKVMDEWRDNAIDEQKWRQLGGDPSRYAVMRGYDALVTGEYLPTYVILNRTAVVVRGTESGTPR